MKKRLSDPPAQPEEKMSVALGRDPPRGPPQSKTPTGALMPRAGIQKWSGLLVKMRDCDSGVGDGEGVGSGVGFTVEISVGSKVGVDVGSKFVVWVGIGTNDPLSGDAFGTGWPPWPAPITKANAPTCKACLTRLGKKRFKVCSREE